MITRIPLLRLFPLAALVATSACFATRNDVVMVQADIASLRTQMMRNDTAQKALLVQATQMLAAAGDSLKEISKRTVGSAGDVRGELRDVKEQMQQVNLSIQQLQRSFVKTAAELESRTNALAATQTAPITTPVIGAPGSVPPGSVNPNAPVLPQPPVDTSSKQPGAAQLYTNGMAQQRRGSTSTARSEFQTLLSTYPNSEYASKAQLNIAQTFYSEKNYAAADVAYAAVVTKYPETQEAPSALYKRATMALQAGNNADARKYCNEIISRYPKSVEADPAADLLKTIR